MNKKINVDECYLVLISRLVDKKYLGDKTLFESKKVKFTIVLHSSVNTYMDLLSDEVYKSDNNMFDNIGTMFVNSNYYIFPLNSLFTTKKQYIKQSELIKILRNPIIKLNELIISNNENEMLDVCKIKVAFELQNKEKKLKMYTRRSKNEKSIWIRF